MAMIQGPGNFSNNPLHKAGRAPAGKPAAEESPSLPSDSAVFTPAEFPTRPAGMDTRVQIPTEVAHEAPPEVTAPGQSTVQTRFETSATPRIPAEFDGAFLVGPGMGNLSGISSIGGPSSTAGVSESVFTNGLGATKLIGLSGKVLADLGNPLGNLS